MKKSFLSMTLLVALALLLLSAATSRGSEGRSAPQPACFVEDDCTPRECGIRNCGMVERGCGLGAVSCGECSENQSCDDGICRLAGAGRQCPCGGSWPSACEACPDQAQPPEPKPDRAGTMGGMSGAWDGYWISFDYWVHTPVLPKDPESPNVQIDPARYAESVMKTEQTLEDPSTVYSPDLEKLDALVQSIEIR